MCGRVVIARCSKDLIKIAKLKNNKDMKNNIYYHESYNISPGQYLPCIYMNKENNNKSKEKNLENEINLEAMKWGIYLEKYDHILFNSRIETINIYPMYKNYKRCIIIIEGYYEWENKNKPYYISTIEKYDNIIFLPGLYNEEIDNEGFSYKSVSIITMNANKEIDFIHERMPVIFNKYEQVLDYLNGKELFKIVDKDIKMKFYLVGDLVNKLSNISKDNIIPKEDIKYNKNGNLLIKNFLSNDKGEKLILKKNENLIKDNKKKLNKINELDNIKEKNIKDDDNISEISTTIINSNITTNMINKTPKIKKNRKREKIFPSLSNSKEKKKEKSIDKKQKKIDNFLNKKEKKK